MTTQDSSLPVSAATIHLAEVDARVTRCGWCAERIGRVRYFDGEREVPSPLTHGLLSDTICSECLEQERSRLERMHQARAA